MNATSCLTIFGLFAMAACSPNTGGGAPGAVPASRSAEPPAAEQPASLPDPRRSGALGPNDKPDACGAAKHQQLVGKPKSDIPPKPDGAVWRVHSTTDVVTQDYSETRMNIVWDAKTGLVVEVKCG